MAAEDWIDLCWDPPYNDDDEPEYYIVGKVIHETDKAWLVRTDSQEIWLPKSQCQRDEDEFIVPHWLANKKGL